MANDPRFYLVVVRGGEATLVLAPAVLRGKGLERYGARDDLLTTLRPGGSAKAVVIGADVIALGDPRVARGAVEVDQVATDVLVVCPDGEISTEELQDVQRWLAQAVLRAGGGWTARAPGTSTNKRDGRADGVARDWRLPTAGLALGLLVGGLVGAWIAGGLFGADAAAIRPENQAHGDAAAQAGATTSGLPGAASATASGDRAASAQAATGVADVPLVAVAAPAESTATGSDRPTLTPADAVALPSVSLWDGGPQTPVGSVVGACNRFGDLVLDVEVGGATVTKTVVCGKFEKKATPGVIRRSVCVPSLRRCALLVDLDLSLAPAYICTPLSGRAYGLMSGSRGRSPRYRNGRAQAGFAVGKPLNRYCPRRAPYARRLRRL